MRLRCWWIPVLFLPACGAVTLEPVAPEEEPPAEAVPGLPRLVRRDGGAEPDALAERGVAAGASGAMGGAPPPSSGDGGTEVRRASSDGGPELRVLRSSPSTPARTVPTLGAGDAAALGGKLR